MKSISKKITIIILLVILLLLSGYKIYKYYDKNPYLVEIQNMISLDYGSDFTVKITSGKNDKIEEIILYSNDSVYCSETIFEKVDSIQKNIYQYMMVHKEHFGSIYSVSSNETVENTGVRLRFCNTDGTSSDGKENVFEFLCLEKYRDEKCNGFNYMYINALYLEYKFSDCLAFEDIKYLNCLLINVDDEDVLRKMKNLKELNISYNENGIKEIAKEIGITVY